MKKELQELEVQMRAVGLKKKPPAKSFAALEKITHISPSLKALWSWSDGATLPIFFDGSESPEEIAEQEGLHFLSVQHALSQKKEIPGLGEGLVPFATDLAGNFLCVESESGRVMDWDHETRKATRTAPSLEKFLAASVKALRKRTTVKPQKASPKPRKDGTSQAAMSLHWHLVGSKLPGVRNKAIVIMNNQRYQGGDKHDDNWVLERSLLVAMKAGDWKAVASAARKSGHPELVLKLARKLGLGKDAARALRGT